MTSPKQDRLVKRVGWFLVQCTILVGITIYAAVSGDAFIAGICGGFSMGTFILTAMCIADLYYYDDEGDK